MSNRKYISNLVELPDDDESIIQKLAKLPEDERLKILEQIVKKKYPDLGYEAIKYDWELWGRPSQLIPLDFDKIWSTYVVNAGRGSGKELCIETPILTKSGWKCNGDLQVGDIIFDEQGKDTLVTNVYDVVIPKKCYRLYFSDGSYLDASSTHRWSTWTHQNRKQYQRYRTSKFIKFPDNWINYPRNKTLCDNVKYGTVKTTEEIVSSFHVGNRKDHNHGIPLAKSLNLIKKDLPIHPYLLGLFLADGNCRDGGISKRKNDIIFFSKLLHDFGYETISIKPQGLGVDCFTLRINGLYKLLRENDLLKNKHIPKDYLMSSESDRLWLLNGLLDGDGTVSGNRSCIEFDNTNKDIADGVYFLLCSLGMQATMSERIGKLYGVEKKRCYRIRATPNIPLFILPRKRLLLNIDKERGQSLRKHHRMIVRYEEIDPKPMRCISVDSPNESYLVGKSLIPTLNTRLASEWVRRQAETQPGIRIGMVGATTNDLYKVMIGGNSGVLTVCPPWNMPVWNQKRQRLQWKNGSIAEYFALDVRTRVPTLNGFKTIEDVEVGDNLFDENGDVCKVVDVTPIMDGNKCYKITFENGQKVISDYDHLWQIILDKSQLGNNCHIVNTGCLFNSYCNHFDVWVKRTVPIKYQINERKEIPQYLAIKNIEETISVPVKCVRVDSKSHLFLITDSFIVTHNSAEKPSRLRGPQFNYAWADEICSWNNLEASLDMLSMCLRLGNDNRLLVTTTPKNIKPFKDLLKLRTTWTFEGSTYSNIANLSEKFIKEMKHRYEGTRLGQQELHAEILDDDKDALWNRDWIENNRIKLNFGRPSEQIPDMYCIVVAVDPAVTAKKDSDYTGIAVSGYGSDGKFYVFEVKAIKSSPKEWAEEVLRLYDKYRADKIIAEVNQGGDLVAENIKNIRPLVSISTVHAKRNKILRAEPIAHLYDLNKVRHLGTLTAAEDQMCSFNPAKYPNALADMVDSLVYSLTYLNQKYSFIDLGNDVYAPAVGGNRDNFTNFVTYY